MTRAPTGSNDLYSAGLCSCHKITEGVPLKSQSVTEGRIRLGKRVREMRKRLGKTLREMSVATGLSNSTLSKIENAALSVSYDNLLKLANSLGADLSALFSDATESPDSVNGRRSVTRSGAGERYDTPLYHYEMLQSELAAKKIIPVVTTLRAHSFVPGRDLIRHQGEEFVYVLEGVVDLHCEFYQSLRLTKGDSIYFDSKMNHALISVGRTDAKVLWVATTPRAPLQRNLAGLPHATKTRRRKKQQLP